MLKTTVLMLLLLFTLAGCQAPVEGPSDLISQTELMAARSLVRTTNVGVKVDLYTQVFGGFFERRAGNAQGSGVLFHQDDEYYYVLTNFHVVNPRDFDRASYLLSPSDETEPIEATLHVFDDTKDLAVLRFPVGALELPLIDLKARLEEPLTEGELLLAVGNPSAINSIVTYGEYLGYVSIKEVDFQVLLHTALIFPGNSGGALTDLNGHLVGLNTWSYQNSDERNLAIPLEEIKTFLETHDLWP